MPDPVLQYFATHTETEERMTVFQMTENGPVQIIESSNWNDLLHARDRSGDVVSDLPVAPGIYRHYKGGMYEVVLGLVRHATTGQMFTVYRAIDARALWARPSRMFVEWINDQPRFARQDC